MGGDHAKDLSSGCQGGARDRAHDPYIAGSVDQTPSLGGERLSELTGGGPVGGPDTIPHAAVDADRDFIGHEGVLLRGNAFDRY